MAQQKYEQDDLPGFLDAEAKARESNIDRQTYIEHKRRLAMRWFAYYKRATVASKQPILQQYNRIVAYSAKKCNHTEIVPIDVKAEETFFWYYNIRENIIWEELL